MPDGGTMAGDDRRARDERLLREQKDLLELIASGTPLADCLNAITAAVSRLQPGTRAAILLADEGRTLLSHRIAPSFGEGLRGAPIDDLAIGACGEAVRRGEPIGSADIAGDERWSDEWRALCTGHDIHACHSEPVPGEDGRAAASLMLCFEEPRPPADWELELARFGVHLARIAIGRDRAARALRDSEGRLRQLLDAMPAAVYTTDADGRIAYCNAAAVALAGRTPVVGEDRWCVGWRLHEPDGTPLPHERCPVAQALNGDPPAGGVEILIERPDGARVPVLAFPALLRDDAGRVTGAVDTLVDISERKEAESRSALLIDELNHRVKNTLAIVQGLAWQTLHGDPDGRDAFQGRLEALAGAHDLLTRAQWQDADLAAIIDRTTAAWRNGRGRVTIEGPQVRLTPKRAVTVAMAMHELATNAAKYGALAHPDGTVSIRWTTDGAPPRLRLTWREADGPPVVPPERHGFGTRMIETALAYEFGGTARLDYLPDGLVCAIDAPLADGRR